MCMKLCKMLISRLVETCTECKLKAPEKSKIKNKNPRDIRRCPYEEAVDLNPMLIFLVLVLVLFVGLSSISGESYANVAD